MKRCSRPHTRNQLNIYSLMLIAMGMFVWNPNVIKTNAKCIHDGVAAPSHKPSPQVYDRRLTKPETETTTAAPLTTAVVEPLNMDNTFEPAYQYFYDYTSFSSSSTNSVGDERTIHKKKRKRNVGRKHYASDSDISEGTQSFEKKRRSVSDNNFDNGITQESDAVAEMFKPLRLSVWYDHSYLTYINGTTEFGRLDTALRRAVEQIGKLFSVIPVQGPLLLSRDNNELCAGVHWNTSSPNYGRCGSINPSYNGERCLDNFQIPDDHLQGFSTYNNDNTEPVQHFSDGGGIPNTDTVVYVRSQDTVKCSDGEVVAYATYCHTDQFNRPVSGFLNFCPRYLSSTNFDQDQFYLSVLHELFHVLGFSKKLFDKFKTCRVVRQNSGPQYECENRQNVFGFLDNLFRILTPTVSDESNQHFNCSRIKGPLVTNQLPQSQVKTVSSHWDSRYLQPSIMTSSIGLSHLTVIDRITLSVFIDTGWYRVNMSQAGQLFWGKNAGCQFGSTTSCRNGDSPFFCTASDVVNGCHYLHLDKGVCETNSFLDSCKMYKATKGSECWQDPLDSTSAEELEQKGEVYTINSRCFISNLSKPNPDPPTSHSISRRSIPEEGRCYEHRCNNTKTLEIRVRGSNWFICPSRKIVRIPDYDGSIRCPEVRLMCNPNIKTSAKSGTQPCATINVSFSNLNIFLNSPLPAGTSPQSRYIAFIKEFMEVVNKLVKANGTEISGGMSRTGTNMISFRLKPVEEGDKQKVFKNTCSEAVRRLKTMVTERLLFVPVEGTEITANGISVKFALAVCNDEVQDTITNNESATGNQNTKQKTPPKSGIVAAITVGVTCTVVFASVGTILYLKSKVATAVGPAMGSGVEVAYQPNPRGSFTTGSESGSMGPIQFPV
nr:leishmanolysin-like peptidase 2 [Ciona intestinalis]|eukprot:XP_018667132.1 leishmanolysin-like peptidase 2 [Ciona intestinalis]